MSDIEEYLIDWLELYPHFCFHLKKTPKEISDERIFKEYFTFERWKEGFWRYKTNKLLDFKYSKLEGIPIKSGYIEFEYSLFHMIPFNIKTKYYEY